MRSRRAIALLLALSTSLGSAAYAEDVVLDDYLKQFEGLLKDILQINIRAKILSADEQLLWEAKKEAYTVPGLEVEVRIPSESLVILAFFTPVRTKDNKILLQVHAELRPADRPRDDASVRYSTTVNYIPAALGDKIRFYPLGEFPDLAARAKLDASVCNLELEIQIVPYTRK